MLTCELVELESPKILLLSPSVSRDAHMVIWHNDTMMQGRRQEFEEGGAELFAPETTWRGAPKIPVTESHTP